MELEVWEENNQKDYKRKSRWSIQAGLGMISAREYKESIAECTAGVKKKS